MAKYGLIGQSLGHSSSVELHRYIGDYDYELIELADKSLLEAKLKDDSYWGFNITIPYKQDVIPYLDEISERAERASAVNCVRRMPDGRLLGYNTDIYGIEYMLGDRAKGKRCVILGTGGGARAAYVALELLGAESVVMVSRNLESVRARFGDKYKCISYEALRHYFDAQLIINATPVGMFPDIEHSPLIEAGINMYMFTELELAVDLIYNPHRTKFLQDAKRITSCDTISGLEMLIIQAVDSRNIWLGRKNSRFEEKILLRNIKRKLLERQLNIVAVGMPGSGKTTIFRRYAYEYVLPFIDVDHETESIMGQSIPEVLADKDKGEEYFRECEFEAVKRACRNTGSVIASGGGSILNPISRDLLRSNGIVIYVKRPLDMLSTKNRPISQKVGLLNLFRKRDRIYKKMADLSISNIQTFGSDGRDGDNAREYNRDMRSYVKNARRSIERYLNEIADNKWT